MAPPKVDLVSFSKGHNFVIPGDIAPKISKDLSGILATFADKLLADR